ncbi:MAG: hypothetical protein JNM19_01950 [Chitinophagaceae bacterium]|nr:hypothetical protein [Chitinophagaceae bacterium]
MKTLNIVFALILMFLFEQSMGQDDIVKIGHIRAKAASDFINLTVYRVMCEADEDYQFVSRSLIRYDSTMQMGYLNSYKYLNKFNCQDSIVQTVISETMALLAEWKRPRKKIFLLFPMEDTNKEFIGVLFSFRKKKFNKMIQRANELVNRKYASEIIQVREYKYHKNAREFILAKVNDKLSLISVSQLPRQGSISK